MEDKIIQSDLNKLGIFSKSQILSHDIDYWWAIKYKEIQSKNLNNEEKTELLTKLNITRERLSIIDLNILIESLSKSKSNKNYSFQKEELTQNTKNEELKSNRIRYFFLSCVITFFGVIGILLFNQNDKYQPPEVEKIPEKNYINKKNNTSQYNYKNYSGADYFAMASERIKNEDYKSALDYINLSLKQDQNNFEVYTVKSWIYVVIYENHKEGMKNANKAITLNPYGHMAYELRGYSKLGLNYEMNEVCKDFKKAYDLGSSTMKEPMINLCNKFYNY